MYRSRFSFAALLAVVTILSAGPALADCTEEVLEAVKKQSQLKSFRVVSKVISEAGPMKLSTDYLLPDRMYQTAVIESDQSKLETILVNDKAWTNEGDGWRTVSFEDVQYLTSQLKTATGAQAKAVGAFDCIGVETYEGKAQRGFKSKPVLPEGLKLKEGTDASSIINNDAVRVVYVDAETGLPARSIFAKADKLDKPIFQEAYFYPNDIAIEAPKDVLPDAPAAAAPPPAAPEPAPAVPSQPKQ